MLFRSFLQAVYQSYFAPNHIPVYANFTQMGDGSGWLPYLNYVDGAMNENFATSWNNKFFDVTSWKNQLSRSAQTVTKGKKQILVCQGSTFDTARQQFCLGSFLLIVGPGAFVRYASASNYSSVFLYDNYNLGIGDPKGNRYQSNGLWKRTFTKGSVTVDPVNHTAQIVVNSGTQLDLTWQDNSSDESGFKIERSLDGVSFSQIATTAANVTRYSNKGLIASKTYYYRIRAFNASGDSAYSAIGQAKTNPVIPASPSGLKTSSVSSTQVNLAWTDSSTNETGFQVERSFNGTQFAIVATQPAGTTSYLDTLLTPAETYYYRISSFNAGGVSTPTPNLKVVTSTASLPADPTNLSATAASSTEIDLNWTDNSNNDEGFKISRSTDGVKFGDIDSSPVNTPSYKDKTVVSGKKYYYRVRAWNSAGFSSYSNTANATTP